MRVFELRSDSAQAWVNAVAKPRRLAALWDGEAAERSGVPPGWDEPIGLEIAGRDWVATDFPFFAPEPLLLSGRAAAALRPHLDGAGALLPTTGALGALEPVVFLCTRVLDAVDFARSDVTLFADRGVTGPGCDAIFRARRLELRPEVIGGATVFRLARHRRGTFVTDAFLDSVERHGLVGLRATPVWSSEGGGETLPDAVFSTNPFTTSPAEQEREAARQRAEMRARLAALGREDLLAASSPVRPGSAPGPRGGRSAPRSAPPPPRRGAPSRP
jgi:hypothetical protein